MSANALEIYITAINEATGAIREVQEQIEGLAEFSRNTLEVGERITNFGQQYVDNVSRPIIEGLHGALNASVEFESQMADLNKAFGLDNGSEQAMEAQAVIMGLSRQLGQVPANIIAIATEAGKLGVQFDQLEDYTRTVTAAAVAFDMSAEQAGSSMAVLTNVLGYQDAQGRVNIEGLQRLGDAINYFADTGATSESAIANVLQRAGGTTRTFGLANESAVALSAAFLNLGYAPEVVGTAMNGMLPMLQNATQQTDKFQDALEQIGLPAAKFERLVRRDAVGAIETLMTAIDASGDTSILQRMFGSGSDSAMMASALQNLDAFRRTLRDTENIPIGSMMETFAMRQETAESSLGSLQASLTRFAITLGSVLLPAMDSIVSALTPMVEGVTQFAQANPDITKMAVAFALVVAAIGPLIVGIGMVVSAVGTIGSAIAAIKGFVLLVSAMAAGAVPMAGMAGAIAGVATAIAGIGFGPILAGIAAIAAGAYLIISNWSAISSFFQTLFVNIATALQPAIAAVMQFVQSFATGFMSAIQPALPSLMQLGMAFQSMLASLWQMIVAFAQIGAAFMQFANAAMQLMPVQMVINAIGAAFQAAGLNVSEFGMLVGVAVGMVVSGLAAAAAATANVVAAFSSMSAQVLGVVSGLASSMFAAGVNIVNSIAQGIRSAIGNVTSAISSVASMVRGALPFSPPEWGPLSDIMSSGGNIVNAIASGIVPDPIAAAMSNALNPLGMGIGSGLGVGVGTGGAALAGAGGAGGGFTINIQTINVGGGGDGQKQADDFVQKLREALPDAMSGFQRQQNRINYKGA